MEEEEIKSKFGDLVKKGIFRSVARCINQDCEERLQEGITQTFEIFKRKGLAGVELEPAVLVCCCRRRATDLSRHLVRGGQKLKDPLDPRAYHLGRVEILHLDGVTQDDGELADEGDVGLEAVAADGLVSDPRTWIVSALDLESWLRNLQVEDRQILGLRQAGHTLSAIADAVKRSLTYVRLRLLSLGKDLAERAGMAVRGLSIEPELVAA